MFRKIRRHKTWTTENPLFEVIDTCFTDTFASNIDDLYVVIADPQAAQMLIWVYERRNLHSSMNLYLYYVWLIKTIHYQATSDNYRSMLAAHSKVLDHVSPQLKFSLKYKGCVEQSLKQAGFL